MPTDYILALLIAERDKINRAIEALGATVKRRGRPPKNAGAVTAPVAPKARKKRIFSPAEREAARQRMKAMWEKRRKAAKKAAKPAAKKTG
jgi:hypothetical protein